MLDANHPYLNFESPFKPGMDVQLHAVVLYGYINLSHKFNAWIAKSWVVQFESFSEVPQEKYPKGHLSRAGFLRHNACGIHWPESILTRSVLHSSHTWRMDVQHLVS